MAFVWTVVPLDWWSNGQLAGSQRQNSHIKDTRSNDPRISRVLKSSSPQLEVGFLSRDAVPFYSHCYARHKEGLEILVVVSPIRFLPDSPRSLACRVKGNVAEDPLLWLFLALIIISALICGLFLTASNK